MAIQRAQRHAVTSAELTSSHPARPIQTCQPLYLHSAPSTNHHSRLSAHKQRSSQILSCNTCALLGRVRSSLAVCFLSHLSQLGSYTRDPEEVKHVPLLPCSTKMRPPS